MTLFVSVGFVLRKLHLYFYEYYYTITMVTKESVVIELQKGHASVLLVILASWFLHVRKRTVMDMDDG